MPNSSFSFLCVNFQCKCLQLQKKNANIVVSAISQFMKLGQGPAALFKIHFIKNTCKANISPSDYNSKDDNRQKS